MWGTNLANIYNTVNSWLNPKPQAAPVGPSSSKAIPASGYTTQYASNPTNFVSGGGGTYSAPQQSQPSSGGGGGGGEDLASIARQALESKLAGINSRLNAMREEGTRQIGVAGKIKDDILSEVTNRYTGLKTEAGTAKSKADAALTEEDRGTVRDYAKSQGSLNKSTEKAKTGNRNLAVALGIGNSSYYLDQQSNANNQLVDKTAGLQNEKDAKLGGIKQRVSEVATWFEQKQTELAQEAASLKSKAELAFQDQVGKIQFAQQTYGIDQSEAAEQAQYEFEGKLASISQYIADKGNQVQQVASSAANQLLNIQGLKGVDDKLAGVLGVNTGMDNANVQTSINGTTVAPKVAGSRAMLAVKPEDEYLYG